MESSLKSASNNIPFIKTIMIVDDEISILDIITDTLTLYNVIPFDNGKSAIEYFKNNCNSIDLVILDVVMPVCSGVDVFRAIRLKRQDIPVIFSTASFLDYDSSVLKEPRVKVLYKPYAIKHLIDMILGYFNKDSD